MNSMILPPHENSIGCFFYETGYFILKYSEELIIHFTCDECKLWWSMAVSNEYDNIKWLPAPIQRIIFCPHCGHKHATPHEKIPDPE